MVVEMVEEQGREQDMVVVPVLVLDMELVE
jgi:hypothetical protein